MRKAREKNKERLRAEQAAQKAAARQAEKAAEERAEAVAAVRAAYERADKQRLAEERERAAVQKAREEQEERARARLRKEEELEAREHAEQERLARERQAGEKTRPAVLSIPDLLARKPLEKTRLAEERSAEIIRRARRQQEHAAKERLARLLEQVKTNGKLRPPQWSKKKGQAQCFYCQRACKKVAYRCPDQDIPACDSCYKRVCLYCTRCVAYPVTHLEGKVPAPLCVRAVTDDLSRLSKINGEARGKFSGCRACVARATEGRCAGGRVEWMRYGEQQSFHTIEMRLSQKGLVIAEDWS